MKTSVYVGKAKLLIITYRLRLLSETGVSLRLVGCRGRGLCVDCGAWFQQKPKR